MIRTRIVITILETCGQYFEKGSLKKKCDIFLLFFQVEQSSQFIISCTTYLSYFYSITFEPYNMFTSSFSTFKALKLVSDAGEPFIFPCFNIIPSPEIPVYESAAAPNRRGVQHTGHTGKYQT